MLTVVHDEAESNATGVVALGSSLLDEIVRDGARQMLAAALRAEVVAYIEAHRGELDDNGHRLVVRNGYHAEREVRTAAGAVSVRQPRVNDKRIDPVTGERVRFSSAILPAGARKSPKVSEVLPLLYLNMWVDGIHLKVRLEQDKVCLLVMIGVRADGTKELIALADGFRESSESFADRCATAWYAPEPDSRTANSSNDPTNQEVISKLRDTPIHGLDYSSIWKP